MADRRRTREQWQDIVDGWPKSGLTQAQYCARQGISVTSFQRWRERRRQGADPGNLQTRRGVAAPIRFLPVELHAAPLAAVTGPALTLVRVNGMRLEVGAGVEAGTLRRVLVVLQESVAA